MFRHSFRIAALAAIMLGAVPAMSPAFEWQFVWASHPSPQRSHSGIGHQLSLAQSDLTRAYVTANKTSTAGGEVQTAQAAVDAARKDYNAELAARRAELAKDPQIARLRESVQRLQEQMAAEKDINVRLRLAAELMPLRNDLNRAEWDVLGADTDLAVAKASLDEAIAKLKVAQARRTLAVQQDPAVLAARQRLVALRQQASVRH